MSRIRVLLFQCSDSWREDVHRLAGYMRDSGLEVIYGGFQGDPEAMCSGAVQEDVDVIFLAGLSNGQEDLLDRLVQARARQGVSDVHVVVLGDLANQRGDPEQGKIFPDNTDDRRVVEWIQEHCGREN